MQGFLKELYDFASTFHFIFFSAAFAEIITTPTIHEVMPYIDQETWFLVDLDNTLFEGKQALGHAHWFYDLVQKKMQNGMSREEAVRDSYPDWVKTQAICDVKPLEDAFISYLKELQSKGIVVMGLTHRQPVVATSTFRQVNSLGLDFLKTAPSEATFSLPSHTPTLYSQGILFVGDYNAKGDILLPFFDRIEKHPKKVVFIDDKRKNVDELEKTLQEIGIEYLGVHYTAIDCVPKVYDWESAEAQYKQAFTQ